MAANLEDLPASTATPAQLVLNVPSVSQFETYQDRDWFRFHADVGQHYRFQALQGDYDLRQNALFYDARGQLIQGASASSFEPLQSGDYYFSVASMRTGAYAVTQQLRPDDYSANSSAPGQLSLGVQLDGLLEDAVDSDRFEFSASAGQVLRFELRLTDGSSNQPWMSFSGPDGKALDAGISDSYTGADGVVRGVMAAPSDGVYAVNISPGWYATGAHYSIKEVSLVTDDHGNRPASATPLAVGVAANGVIDWSGDHDYFSVQLIAGTTYTLSRHLLEDAPGSVSVDFKDSRGNNVSGNVFWSASDSSFTPTTTGTYYLDLSERSQTPVSYTMTLSQTPDDFGATFASAGQIVADGAPVLGNLDTGGGDRDWFTVALDAGQTYWVWLDQPATYPSVVGAATVNIFDLSGKLLASTANISFNDSKRILPFVPNAKGTYVIEVAGNHDGQGGNYQLVAQHGAVDDVGNDAAHASPLALNQVFNGKIELATDKDVFKLHVEAGNVYRLTAKGTGGDAHWTDGIYLRSDGGYFEDVGIHYNSHRDYLYRPTTSGDLYFTVSQNADYNSVKTGSYSLQAISYGKDDFPQYGQDLTALAVGGKLAGAVNFPGDVDSFTVHLEAGRSYVFDLQGALSGVGTLDTTTASLSLFGAAGLSTSKLAGGEARLAALPRVTGDYQISVVGDSLHLGSYVLTAVQTSGDTSAPALLTPADLDSPGWPARFTLQFSESVMPGSGAFVLKDSSGAVFAPHGQGSLKVTVASNQLWIDAGGYLAPGETYTLSLASNSALDLAGNSLAAPASVRFHTAPAASQGSSGDDLLVGRLNGAHIDGGAGLDTVYYAKTSYQFDIQRGKDGITVKQPGSAGSDLLTGVERIMLQDRAIALDLDGHGGQAYRLYQAAFNRAPDSDGLGFWIAAMDKGVSLQSVARGFTGSAEFQAMYGSAPSDASYLNQLYHNVLHRDGDASGTAFWLDILQHGHGRDEVLAAFSESAENQAALIGITQNGMYYTPYA